jgi:DNA topoisomerase-1
MAPILLIVESPAKCKKIEQYLGSGYKCIASFGHIRELNGLRSINTSNNFHPTFIECESKKNQIAKIRELISSAKEVLLASDDDREGEAISWHICQVFNLNVEKTKRIIFHEVTESALKHAVANPVRLNMSLVNAQIARQILDVLVGYKISPLLWKYIPAENSKNLSAGRCQTPALRLIYENQKEIDILPGNKVYNTVGYFTAKNLPFVLNKQHENCETVNDFLTESVNHTHIYTCSALRDTIKQPPTPFTTSTIQQTASNELHLSPKETMQICQKLYEGGYITYMRTDSIVYSHEFQDKAKTYITKTYGVEYFNATAKEVIAAHEATAKEATAAHEAIRPTDITMCAIDNSEFSNKEIKLYDLIRRHTLESCMTAATYKAFTAAISAPTCPVAQEYRFSVEKIVFPGWKIVSKTSLTNQKNEEEEETNDDKHFVYLQTLKSGSVLPYKKIIAKACMKELKMHYTEARLVQLLEQQGIGRPSTFSSLIEKIQDRGYVKKMDIKGELHSCIDYELEGDELSEIEVERAFGNEKNKLVIQSSGLQVMDFLLTHFEMLFQYTYTKQMEDSLDLIANNLKIWYELCAECLTQIEILTAKTLTNKDIIRVNSQNAEKEEIRIDTEHVYIIGKYGPVIKYTKKGSKTCSFKPLRTDIDLDKLRRGEYKLVDIIATTEDIKLKINHGELLGQYKEQNIYFKTGKFGPYIECGDVRKSLAKETTTITLADAIIQLSQSQAQGQSQTQGQSTIVRKITEDMTIRVGQYGDYLFYKKKTMKTPKFFKLNDFNHDYKKCDVNILKNWIKEVHGV